MTELRLKPHKANILVVDDDTAITDYASLRLSHWGYGVRVAHDSLTGMALAQKHRPDCILLDLAMPEVDGFDFLIHRKKVPAIADIPVVILSANHRGAEVQRALMLGAKGYVTKPIDDEALLRRLERVVPSPLYTPAHHTAVAWGDVAPKSLL